MKKVPCSLLICKLCLPSAMSAGSQHVDEQKKPKIAVVLASGGAKNSVYIGVSKALDTDVVIAVDISTDYRE